MPEKNDLENKTIPSRPHLSRRAALEPQSDKGEKLEEWMLTYMDTVTLLVTLFVLILSFSSMTKEKYDALVEGLRLDKHAAGMLSGNLGIMDMPAIDTQNETSKNKETDAEESERSVEARLEEMIKQKGLDDIVSIGVSDGLLDLQLQDNVLFPSGSAELLKSGDDVLARLIPILSSGDFEISIQGHTDSVPISTPEYPSNWELSGNRAASVLRSLVSMGIDEGRLDIAGFAHTHPVGDNATQEGRLKNRRVNILLRASPDEIEKILSKQNQSQRRKSLIDVA